MRISKTDIFKGILLLYSIIKFLCPQINFYMQEDIMEMLQAINPALVPFAFGLNVVGYWLKKCGLPKWCPPLPITLFLISFMICALFGWAHTAVEGWKGVLIVVGEYGLGNGAIVTLMSTYGYDVVHGFTKSGSNSDPVLKEFKYISGGSTIEIPAKIKKLAYPVSAGAAFVLIFLLTFLLFREGVFYAACWGILAAGTAFTIARAVLHIAEGDYSAEMWQVEIYLAAVCAGWCGAILSTTWGLMSLCFAVMLAGILMAVGTRFIRYRALVRTLEETLVYKPTGDVIGGDPDITRPICSLADGTAITVAEAEKQSDMKEAVEAGKAYIVQLIANSMNTDSSDETEATTEVVAEVE